MSESRCRIRGVGVKVSALRCRSLIFGVKMSEWGCRNSTFEFCVGESLTELQKKVTRPAQLKRGEEIEEGTKCEVDEIEE